MNEPASVRDWLSVEVGDTTYLLDAGFLTSNWRCIYGEGCPGIAEEPAPELAEGCCTHGAYLSDAADRKRVVAHARRLSADQWQNHDRIERMADVIEVDDDGARSTAVVDDACIFLNRPDFPGGAGCALHRAALEAGERPLDWKPEVCWQLPLRLEHHRDDNDHDTYLLREWRRRDWGEGGIEFHWWCVEDDRAFVDHEPVYITLRDEIIELVGAEVYEQLADTLGRRPPEVLLPHPVLRRQR